VLGGGNCYEYDTVEGLSESVLRSINVIFGELENLPDDYGVYTQTSETRFVPALALVAFATIFHIFTFCLYAMMYYGKLRMWETSSFLMWIFAIICIFTFTSILLIVDSKLYNPSVSELPFCLNYNNPSNMASSISLEYGPGLVSIVWLLLSSGFQVLILMLVNIYGTVKSAAALRKAGESIQKHTSKMIGSFDGAFSPRSSKDGNCTKSIEPGIPRSDSDHTQRTKKTITWLRKAAMFEMVFFVAACVTSATSWFHLRCYSDFFTTVPKTFFDQTVTYYSLLEVCFFEPYPDGECFSYDVENSPFTSDQKNTFDPMAAMVFLAVITHFVLFIFFTFFSTAQIFTRQFRDTFVDRALHLENNFIPFSALSLSLWAAFLHLMTIIILTTSEIYQSSVADIDFCSADLIVTGSDGGFDFDDGLGDIPGDILNPDEGDDDLIFLSPRGLTRGVGPATVLTILLFLFTLGEVIYVRLICPSAFVSSIPSPSVVSKGNKESSFGVGADSYLPRKTHGKQLSGIIEVETPTSPASSEGTFSPLKASRAFLFGAPPKSNVKKGAMAPPAEPGATKDF
jgi:hypothetical protein